MDKLPNKIKTSLEKGKLANNDWTDDNKLSLLINESINIEKNIEEINNINSNMKKCNDEMKLKIKFSPEDNFEINKYIEIFNNLGKIYKENKENKENIENIEIIDNINNVENLENKYSDKSTFYIKIKSLDKEPIGPSINFFGFNSNEYNKYFSNKLNYDEDTIVLTTFLEPKNIKDLDEMKNVLLTGVYRELYSIRKEENKLYLDLIIKINDIEYLKKFFSFDINPNEFVDISVMIKNNLSLDKFVEMDFEDFITNVFSFIISIKGKTSNFENVLKKFEKDKGFKKI